jgi:hypothetical protein
MTWLLRALRGLTYRAGTSVSILLTAVVAVAAVTVGPAYYAAAQSSILQDTVGQAAVNGRGFELNQAGPVNAIAGLTGEGHSLLARYLGGHAVAARMFAPPVTAAETTVQADSETVPLVYRSGVCGHLHFTAGHCPVGRGQVAVSTSLACCGRPRARSRSTATGSPSSAAVRWPGSSAAMSACFCRTRAATCCRTRARSATWCRC